MSTKYRKRVSFNSLTPGLPSHQIHDEDLKPLHIPQQYLTQDRFVSNTNLNYGWDISSPTKDVDKMLESMYNLSNQGSKNPSESYRRKKAPKLPPPPSRSSLKNKGESPGIRRKSLKDWTDEELLGKDGQFNKSGGVDLNQMKFGGDSYLPMNSGGGDCNNLSGKPSNPAKLLTASLLTGDIDKAGSKEHNCFQSFSINFSTENFVEENCRRTVSIFINSQHQFDSLIWCVQQFIQESDHLIIIYEINDDFNPFTNSTYVDETNDSERHLNCKINRVINYYFKLIDLLNFSPELSVTFEIIQNIKIWKILKKLEDLYPNLSNLLIPCHTLDKYHLTHQTLAEVLGRNEVNLKVVKVPKIEGPPQVISRPSTADSESSSHSLIDTEDPLYNPDNLSIPEMARHLSRADLDDPFNDYLNPQPKQKELQLPKITFSDTTHPGRKGSTTNGNGSRDGSVHSRATSTSSTEVKKVRSLLDDFEDEEPSPFEGDSLNVKFHTPSNMRKTLSNTERVALKKQSSHGSSLSVDRGLKQKQRELSTSSSSSDDSGKNPRKKSFFGLFSKRS